MKSKVEKAVPDVMWPEIFNDTTIHHSQRWAIQKYNIANDELFNDTPIQHS